MALIKFDKIRVHLFSHEVLTALKRPHRPPTRRRSAHAHPLPRALARPGLPSATHRAAQRHSSIPANACMRLRAQALALPDTYLELLDRAHVSVTHHTSMDSIAAAVDILYARPPPCKRCANAVLCCANAVLCCAVQTLCKRCANAVLCCAVLCCAVLCCALLCCAVLCCAVQTLQRRR